MYCQNCGTKTEENSAVCEKCGAPVQITENNVKESNPKPTKLLITVLLVLVSLWFPLFGIVFWIFGRKEYPKYAKACGIAVCAYFGLVLLLVVVYSIIALTI